MGRTFGALAQYLFVLQVFLFSLTYMLAGGLIPIQLQRAIKLLRLKQEAHTSMPNVRDTSAYFVSLMEAGTQIRKEAESQSNAVVKGVNTVRLTAYLFLLLSLIIELVFSIGGTDHEVAIS